MYSPVTDHIEIDRALRSVRKDGQEIHLTGLEYALLDYLAVHANHICTRDDILNHVWGSRFQYDTGTIDVHLNALRRKLEWSKNKPVETIRGVGLMLRKEREVAHYTIDLQTFLSNWLHSRETDIRNAGLAVQVHLSPFVNEITIEPEALRRMLDSILSALLPSVQPGVLKLVSKLTVQNYILSLEINGTVNELRIPLHNEF